MISLLQAIAISPRTITLGYVRSRFDNNMNGLILAAAATSIALH
jgi:hypothetical protein